MKTEWAVTKILNRKTVVADSIMIQACEHTHNDIELTSRDHRVVYFFGAAMRDSLSGKLFLIQNRNFLLSAETL